MVCTCRISKQTQNIKDFDDFVVNCTFRASANWATNIVDSSLITEICSITLFENCADTENSTYYGQCKDCNHNQRFLSHTFPFYWMFHRDSGTPLNYIDLDWTLLYTWTLLDKRQF